MFDEIIGNELVCEISEKLGIEGELIEQDSPFQGIKKDCFFYVYPFSTDKDLKLLNGCTYDVKQRYVLVIGGNAPINEDWVWLVLGYTFVKSSSDSKKIFEEETKNKENPNGEKLLDCNKYYAKMIFDYSCIIDCQTIESNCLYQK